MRPGQRYYVSIQASEPWYDGKTPISASGMKLTDFAAGQRPVRLLTELFKRSVGIPWFTMILRVGKRGGDETYILPDTYSSAPFSQIAIRPRIQGALYLYLNDAVLGVPYFNDIFYRDNSGKVKVTVRRLS